MNNDFNQLKIERFLTDTLVIAAITSWAYLLSYFYEREYLSYFSLSARLIVVDFSSVLFALIFIVTSCASLWFSSYFLLKKSESDTPVIKEIKIIGGLFFITVLVPILYFGFNRTGMTYSLFFALFVIDRLIELYKADGSSIKAKIEFIHMKMSAFNLNPFDWFSFNLKRTWIFKILFIGLTFYIAGVHGFFNASNQRTWYLIQGTPELAIITMYGDRIIAMPLNRANSTLESKLHLFNVDQIAEASKVINIEKIGPLKVLK